VNKKLRNLTQALAYTTTAMLAFFSVRTFAAEAASLPLSECRLEHPLHVSSVAARCATFNVPEDRQQPDKNLIGLHVAVVPALNRRSTSAPLFILAGGPGQSASDLYVTVAGAFARINRDHDIVIVDQRGTGASHALQCDYPEDWQEPPDPLPEIRKQTEACLNKLGPGVRFYTTSVAVQDLDAVRAALGYEQIDLYGASYGTRVAELYMRRFPARAHAVILDGVTYPEQVVGVETPQDADRALDLIIARCKASKDCAAAYPEFGQDLETLLQKFGNERVNIVINDPNSGLPRSMEFSRRFLNVALRLMSYNATQAALLPTLLHQGAHGSLSPLAAQAVMSSRQLVGVLAAGMQYSVLCAEDAPFMNSADRAAMAKTFMGTDLIDSLQEVCKLWPKGPVDADFHKPLHSDVPTLLLSGEADPVTPPAYAERTARGLVHHRHLVLSGEGHGQLGTGCVPKLMAEFLNTAAPEELDAECLQRHLVMPFFVNSTGPAP
jgi:pimeloyl-ACP methyl ester carboxylesterase